MKMENPPVKVLIAATGSVAALKVPLLVDTLLKSQNEHLKFELRLVVTEKAKHFFSLGDIPQQVEVFDDEKEWKTWKGRGDPVLHVDLAKWANIMVIAPLDANTLAKMAQGLCDNVLTCTTRAWDLKKPLIFCPAMNTTMWEHPVTSEQIIMLKSWGHIQVPPIVKTLMCGDTGVGAMAEVDTIVKEIKSAVNLYVCHTNGT